MPDSPAICPVCGARLMTETGGLCPKCTLRQTLDIEPAASPANPADVDGDWIARHGLGDGQESAPDVRMFAGYRLEGELGRGGMGVVYAALQPGMNRRVALKILSPTMSGPGGDARRFQNEVEAASRLDHPNLLPVYEYGEHEGQWFYTMKLAEGGNLAEHLSDFGFRDSDSPQAAGEIKEEQRRIAGLILHLTRALAYAHQRGILHRDLKPANILLDAEGTALISDFGLAKFLEEDRGLTLTQGVVGTPGYMAPEQARGRKEEVTTATDVYGLGTILYELLTGRAPFQGDSTVETLRQVVEEEVRPPHQIRPRINRDLETICLKCLAKEPSQRYPTANALAEDLERWLAGELITARPANTVERAWRWCRRRPALGISYAALVLAVAVGVGGVLSQWNRAEEQSQENARNLYAADMLLAQQAYEKGDIQQAFTLLERHIPSSTASKDQRGFEWRYLWRRCQDGDALHSLDTEGSTPRVAVSAERIVAVSPTEGLAQVWDATTMKELRELRVTVHPSSEELPRGYRFLSGAPLTDRMVVSENAEVLAGVRRDGAVEVWRLPDRQPSLTLHDDGTVRALALSPKGEELAILTTNRYLIWDCEKNQQILSVFVESSPTGHAFSPDGTMFAVGFGNVRVRLWDTVVGKELEPLDVPHSSVVFGIAFSPDTRLLATSSLDTTIKIWDLATRRLLSTLQGHRSRVYAIAYSPDGKTLASASGDGTIRLWNLEEGEQRILRGHRGEVISLSFSPDGDTLVSGSTDHTVRTWSVHPQPPDGVLTDHTAWVFAIDISPGSDSLASGGFDGTLSVFDLLTGDRQDLVRSQPYDFFSVQYSRDGTMLATGEGVWTGARADGTSSVPAVKLWDLSNGEMARRLNGLKMNPVRKHKHAWQANAAAFSPDGNAIAGGGVGDILIWSRVDGTLLGRIQTEAGRIMGIRWSPDGQFLASVHGNSDTKLWDAQVHVQVASLSDDPNHDYGTPIDFSPDSRWLAFGSSRLRLFNTLTRKIVVFPRAHHGAIMSIRFSPDGKTIATGSIDHSVKLWSLAANREVASLKGHSGPVSGLAFSSDGTLLASSGEDTTIRLWRALPSSETPAVSPQERR